jgi:hypothetical protein
MAGSPYRDPRKSRLKKQVPGRVKPAKMLPLPCYPAKKF